MKEARGTKRWECVLQHAPSKGWLRYLVGPLGATEGRWRVRRRNLIPEGRGCHRVHMVKDSAHRKEEFSRLTSRLCAENLWWSHTAQGPVFFLWQAWRGGGRRPGVGKEEEER